MGRILHAQFPARVSRKIYQEKWSSKFAKEHLDARVDDNVDDTDER